MSDRTELLKLWKDRLERFKQKPEVAKGMDPATAMGVQHGRLTALKDCIVELEQKTKGYPRPDDLPGRVCRVLEGFTLLELKPSKESLEDLVYRFTHIASGHCDHEDWMEDFLETEKLIEELAYTSPAERERRKKERQDEVEHS